MLSENIKAIRKSKGLSQQELAIKLNVVRQTISKWEQGLSVPDSDMLISLSEVLETPVSTLLGETVTEAEVDNLKAISEKLEVINLQLAQRKTTRRKIIRWLLVSLCAIILMIFAALIIWSSPYLGWDYSDPETAVLGVAFHSFEWLFVRVYQNISSALSDTGTLITTLIIVITAVSMVLIILILSMSIRSRKRETGILLAVGIAKPAVILQYVLETLLIAVVAFPLAYLSSKQVAGTLGTLFGKAAENVIVTPEHFMLVAIVGGVLLVAAVLVSSISTLRLKPKQILAQME